MKKRTTIIDYVISVCKDMNEKLNIARNYNVLKKSKSKEDKKKVKDLIRNNKHFKTEEEIDSYYIKKSNQINSYWKSLNDTDKITAFSDDEACRVVFKDIIKDDKSIMKEKEVKKE